MFKILRFVPAMAVAITLSAAADVRADRDDPKCAAFDGPFSAVNGPPCTSPIGLCTHGLLGGDFPAKYDATFLTLVSANDPSDPTKFLYTGVSIVTPTDGSGILYTNDTGIAHIPADNSPATFVTKAIVDHGTKKYRRTSGGFVAGGSLVFATGEVNGTFSAVLCKSRDE